MEMNQIRNWVKDLYPHSASWHRRVDRMFDQQVFAIWKDHERKKEKEIEINGEQLTLF